MAASTERSRRLPPEQRLDDLVTAATAVLSRTSFRRAQMADVAREMGVSPGALYSYVEGKEALLSLVLRRALDGEMPSADEVPVAAPPLAETLAWLDARLDWVSDFPALEAAFARRRVTDVRAEVGDVVLELYDVLSRVRPVVRILEHSAVDFPQVAALFARVRRELFARMARYVELRARKLRPLEDLQLSSRLVVEATFWAAHRRPDEGKAGSLDERVVRKAVRSLAVNTLVSDPPPRG